MRKMTANDLKAIPWLYKRMRKHALPIWVMTVASVLRSVLNVVFALVTQRVIDAAVDKSSSFVFDVTVLLGVIVLSILCSLVYEMSNEGLSITLERSLRQSLYHKLIRADYASISSYHSGDLVNRMNSDVSTVNDGIIYFVPATLSLFVSLIVAVVAMVHKAPRFAIYIIPLMILVSGATLFFRYKISDLTKRDNESNGKYTGFVQETLGKLLMVHALDVSPVVEAKADALLTEREKVRYEKRKYNLILSTSMPILTYAVSFTAMVWCAWEIMHGRMSVGNLTAITQLAARVQTPIANLPYLMRRMFSTGGAAERLMELDQMSSEPEVEAISVSEDYSCISASSLSFAYGDRESVLDSVSFSIPLSGNTVITGPSGVGKSTLLKLMLGIYAPTSGTLSIDSTVLSRSTRGYFSYAPQGNLLLSGSLRENIMLANKEATESDLSAAVYASCLDEVISELPFGLDTVIGENGYGLSEGQAQRLSIARAVISSSPILLLDEVTSSLDSVTEEKVVSRLFGLTDRVCIVVTHRPAPLALADFEVSMDYDGVKVINRGSKL